ncbi:hypothetical protein STRTUCAR8_00183 [Streptomyces turgidiscabies Car8]|uniref:Tc1-like transposase DDE domain-containing protein n=1 Tax=Streptomyces turgidiscabies (strain Car8) TaxID=698760 RepID=L7F5I2_STRT8|nr:hypothetical protein STRTUCAR8_00183 [Streptomyces turgidiscabies Car8]
MANNVEIAYTPANSSWLNRIKAQFTALRYFTPDGTDHADHREQGTGQHDPSLHHLAEPPWRRQAPPRRGRQRERCLMRHQLRTAAPHSRAQTVRRPPRRHPSPESRTLAHDRLTE